MRPLIRLPRSASRRTALEAAQLVRRIIRGRRGAFRLEGVWLKPGKVVTEDSLVPGPDWPSIPHLIEIFPSASSLGRPGGSRIDVILWRFSRVTREWVDICHIRNCDSSWHPQIEPVLSRSLERARAHIPAPDLSLLAKRIVDDIERELVQLGDADEREAFLNELWVQIGFRVCREQDDMLGDLGALGSA